MNTLTFGKAFQAMKKKTARLRRVMTASVAELSLLGLAFSSVVYSAVPATAFADVSSLVQEAGATEGEDAIQLQIAAMKNKERPYGILPESDLRGPVYTKYVTATAYNSLPEQTDSTPFITASGTRTRWGVVAVNGMRIGTKIKIPELYGDQVFIVEDRMNARYGSNRLDIWMEEYGDARQFGVRKIKIEVYK